MRRSFTISVIAHLAIAALLVALSRLSPELPAEEQPITVEIVTEAPAPSPRPPKPAPAQAAPAPPRQAAAPAPPPPAPEPETKAEPKPPPPVAQARPEPETPEPVPEPPAKPVEATKPEPAPEPKQEAAPRPEPAPKPVPKKPEPEPEPKKPEIAKPAPVLKKPKPPPEEKPTETAKAEPKPEKPKTPPAAKTEANDFDALLRSVEAQPKRVQAPEKRDGKGASAEAGGTGQPGEAKVAQINPSLLVASISRQITPCWNIPIAAQGIGGLRAELNIALGPDGSVQSVSATDTARMRTDPVFRAFAESAVRAVQRCSPLKLPPESYQVWRNIIFNFDPSLIAG
jgi:outer membrane biosynthesis protein TonB